MVFSGMDRVRMFFPRTTITILTILLSSPAVKMPHAPSHRLICFIPLDVIAILELCHHFEHLKIHISPSCKNSRSIELMPGQTDMSSSPHVC